MTLQATPNVRATNHTTFWIQCAATLSGSVFLALMAQLSVYIPFSPVPITMQTLGIFLLAGFLGSRLAALSVITYLGQGCCGLPIFAGGVVDPLWFCGPRAGYLIGFVVAAFVVGKLIEKRQQPGFISLFLSILIGELIICDLGWTWLSLFLGFKTAFQLGVVPFVIGDAFKCLSATLILQGALRLRKKTRE